jgi:menaquinone-specific isochorismate synthase
MVRDLALPVDEAKTSSDQPRAGARAAIVSVCEEIDWVPDPLTFLAAASAQLGDGTFWQQPEDATFAGAGIAAEIVVHGPSRIAEANAEFRELRERVVTLGVAARCPILGGFAFGSDPSTANAWHQFPGGRLIVPRVLLQIEREKVYLRLNQPVPEGTNAAQVQSESEHLRQLSQAWLAATEKSIQSPAQVTHQAIPDTKAWQASVTAALSAIDRHTIDKVVLAREERISTDEPLSTIDALRRAQSRNANATLFAMQSGTSWFFGATPERLVRLTDERVDVTCLAGSIAIGNTPQEQEQFAHELLASAKNREEHEIVVCAAYDALEPVCSDVRREPGSPRVVTARSVQHLETRVTATVPPPGNVLDLVERLHPTPAVGGYPQQPALDVMRGLESIDRGWYAGPFGWVDLTGSGEFAVAIRSAVVDGATASLFAGCGIVAGSDPHEELAETEMKLQPMRAALGLI